MNSIFISYSRQDINIAKEIYKFLKDKLEIDIFLDENNIEGGVNWINSLNYNIKNSHILLILYSKNWDESKWCLSEYMIAKSLGKEIIYIIIDDTNPISALDNNIQKYNYRENRDLNKLANRLEELLSKNHIGYKLPKSILNPYCGLKSYSKDYASLFFGREDDINSIKEKINVMIYNKHKKILNIISASGLGKSSLLKAGVLPNLEKFNKELYILPTIRPTIKPLTEFAKVIAKTTKQQYRFKEIINSLKSSKFKEELDDFLDLIDINYNKKNILLPIDQAEELYTLSDINEREYFFKTIEYLIYNMNFSFLSILTFRTDIFKEFQNDQNIETLQKLSENYILYSIKKESLNSIIKKPAKIMGVEIEDELVDRLKNDLQKSDALPLLSFVLYQLYQQFSINGKITLQNYLEHSNGTLIDIISKKADEIIGRYNNKIDTFKEFIVDKLIKISTNNEYLKTQAPIESIPIEINEIIDDFIENRLIIKDNKTVEFVHESIIRNWGFLKDLVVEQKEFLILKNKIEIAYKDWQDNNKNQEALISGLLLNNALDFIDRFNEKLQDFINKSKAKEEEKQNRLQEALNKAKHNIGVAQVNKAKTLSLKNISIEASYFAYTAMQNLEKNYNNVDIISEAKNIILNNEPLFLRSKIFYYNRDVTKVALNRELVAVSFINKIIKIWDINSGKILHTIDTGHKKRITSLVIYGKKIISASWDKTVKIWDIESGKNIQNINTKPSRVNCISINKYIFVGLKNKYIKIYDIQTQECIQTLIGHKNIITDIADNKKVLVSASWDKTVKLWDIETGELLQTLIGHEESVTTVAINEKIIVSGSEDKTIKVWDIESGKLLQTLIGHKNSVTTVAINEKIIVSGSEDKTIKVWDIETGELMQTLIGHEESITSVSVNNKVIISGSKDKTIRVWGENKDLELLQKIKVHKDKITNITIYGQNLYSCSLDSTIKVWDIENKKLLYELYTDQGWIHNISTDGKIIVSSTWDKVIKVWDIESKKLIKVLTGHAKRINTIESNKKVIVSGSDDRTLNIWDITSGKLLKTLIGYQGKINSVAINEKIIVSGSLNKIIKIWDIESGELLQTLIGHKNSVTTVAINEKIIVSGSKDKTIKVWDIETGKLLQTLIGHKNSVTTVAINEKIIVSGSKDKTINVWDIESGKLLQTLIGHEESITSLAIYKDLIISASNDKKIYIWNINLLNNSQYIIKQKDKLKHNIQQIINGIDLIKFNSMDEL